MDIFATAIGIGIESKNKDKEGNTKINILPKEVSIELPEPIIKLKDEELIRDTILWTLKENFIIANGEVFRVNGKTDIHVDFNGKTAFIAECKV